MRIGVASMRLEPERRQHALADHASLLAALSGDDIEQWTDLVESHLGTFASHLRPAR
jgi:DNA-binding GntR family transcriptional regulator